jgi:hypothetical protein
MILYKAHRAVLRDYDCDAIRVLIAKPVDGAMAGPDIIQ